ncbi:MAG: type II secretion system protein, partial [Phycisphaerae bacterium]|nr:type II secretion system protein [Phycisphaerae bacterium]
MTQRLPHHAGFTRPRRGMTLVEVAISTVVVGVMLCAALTTVGSSATARRVIADRTRGAMLADGLVTEIAGRAYREPTTSPILFGPESGESTGGNRSEFDDVDDFHNWSASPPSRADGTPVPGFTGWTRNAVVDWV